MRIYISSPSFHIRKRTNTDWQYQHILKFLPHYAPDLTLYFQRALLLDCQINFRFAAGIAAHRFGLRPLARFAPTDEGTASRRDLRRAHCDVVYSYGIYPTNIHDIPVVYHTGATYPEEMSQRGISKREIDQSVARKRRSAERASLVTANSYAALENLGTFMPDLRSKMRMIPFFLPHIQPVGPDHVQEKFLKAQRIHLLFVGREARRKGLPQVLESFLMLDQQFPGRLHLTAVSSLSDGPVEIPPLPNLKFHQSLPRESVQNLMRESHIVLMPSSREGYGWVYLEAMAAGAVPVACDYPIQREILDEGRCGLLVRQSAIDIADKLYPYLRNVEALQSLAERARNHCAATFTPQVVAARMAQIFAEASETGR